MIDPSKGLSGRSGGRKKFRTRGYIDGDIRPDRFVFDLGILSVQFPGEAFSLIA